MHYYILQNQHFQLWQRTVTLCTYCLSLSSAGWLWYWLNNNNNRIQRRNSRFLTISSLRRKLSPTHTLKWPRHNHVQTTWNCCVACHVVRTDSSAIQTEFYFSFILIGWTIKPMKEGRKPEYLEKTPGYELQEMPHTTVWKFKPQARLKPAQ